MIILYDTKGSYLAAMRFLADKMETDACETVHICGTLEECAPHIDKEKKPYMIDLRLVQRCVDKDMDFCTDEALDIVYDMLSPVESIFGDKNRNMLYVFVLPETAINHTDYLIDSLVPNLNMMKGMGLKPLPETLRTYVGKNPDIAYSFEFLSKKAITEARHAGIKKEGTGGSK
jgi:hypothetical protein